MKNPHIILQDGKLWAFEPPEKPEFCSEFVGRTDGMGALECSFPEELTCMCGKKWFEYHSAYSLALEQKLEVENPELVFRKSWSGDWIMKDERPGMVEQWDLVKENEPIKWEGGVEYGWQIKVSTAIDSKYTSCTEEEAKSKPGFHSRRVVRLIAPVKEENSAMSYTEGSEADDPLSISGHIYRPPVPSEQEKQESQVTQYREIRQQYLAELGRIWTKEEVMLQWIMTNFTLTRK